MEIKGRVHCLFEQSGTFKNEFKRLGYEAYDYDIQNDFGETDYTIDLFGEIENAYNGGGYPSIFDSMCSDDLIMAFFPCVYFSCMSQMMFSWTHRNYRKLSAHEKAEQILKRSGNRETFFRHAVRLHAVCHERGLRMIMENPWSEQTFLKSNFLYKPTIIDNNRMLRGDYFRKPTAYWFVNAEPTGGMTIQNDKERLAITKISPSGEAGVCSKERSMISPDYARNFINDFILGISGQTEPDTLTIQFDNT